MKKEEFKVLSDREHVLARSGMYIGSVVPEELSGIIDFKYQTTRISPGLIKLVEEIYQNAIDDLKEYGNRPAKSSTPGVALVSGFSPAILSSVLGREIKSPYDTMLDVIGNPRYEFE